MYSEKVRQQALKLVESGLSPAEAASQLGGHPTATTIKKWMAGSIPTGRRAKRCYVPVDDKVKAINRLFLGEDYMAVAAEIGCSPSSLLTWRRMYLEGGRSALLTPRDVREQINEEMRKQLEEQGY